MHNYINSHSEFNTDIKFGTLSEYFELVNEARPMNLAPTVTGDFFPYADVRDNYWTGFFNSRPFDKWFDRFLEHWIQAVDTLFSLAIIKHKSSLWNMRTIQETYKHRVRIACLTMIDRE